MKSRLLSDLQDSSAGDPMAGDINLGPFFPEFSTGHGSGTPLSMAAPASTPLAPIVPNESMQAMAAVSGSGGGGPGAVVAETSSSGFTINLIFDAAAMAAPASFRAGIEQAAAILSATVTNKITVNFNIDYSGSGGGAAAGPDGGQYVNYSTVRADLIANAAPGDTTFNALPNASTIQGQSQVAVWNAQLKLFGQLSANSTTTDDGSATFATDINPNLLVGVALHELTHAMGRVPYGAQPDIFDFYRFTSPGTRLFTDNIPAASSYFSLDGGNTKLADIGVSSDPSDFLNSGVQGGNDPFNEYYSSSTLQSLTAADLKMLDAMGFNTTSQTSIVIQTDGTTALAQVGSNYFLEAVGTGTGPELKYNGAAVTPGEFGGWTPIGAIQTASGYDVVWKVAGVDQYSIWSTDANGNYVSNLTPAVSGSNYTLESYETTFQQDINGDGTIGLTSKTIQTDGSTSLTQVADEFFIYNAGVGPSLKYNGGPVTPGEFGGWTPIGAIQTASGYDVVWKVAGTDQYSVWSTDNTGNYISNLTPSVSGSSTTLENFETIFHQDLNGDGTVGIPTAVIQVDGSTSLSEGANEFFLYNGGIGPSLKYGGTAVTAGEFGGWTPIGAIQTASGYDVAWKVAGVDQYSIWSTDANGNYVSNLTPAVSGSNYTLESYETTFQQDINGDGTIGLTSKTIQTDGSTSLTQVADEFFIYNAGVGPSLKYNGGPVTAGEFGSWTPIGAIQSATGYDIAWKVAGTDQYSIWATDGSGNYVMNLTPSISGSSVTLENFETAFHQDLNGDGIIGLPVLPMTVIEANGSTALTQIGSNYFLDPVGGGTGPELNINGVAAVAGQLIGWTPIGTEQTATGYEVAFKLAGTNDFTVWSTNGSGTYLSNLIGVVPGTDPSLESIETSFHQDLNGDGVMGVPLAIQPVATPNLQFAVNAAPENFEFAGNTGPIIQNSTSAQNNAVAISGPDIFVFAPNFGQVSIVNFAPATDTIEFSKTVFANVQALLAATHDSSANAVITDAAHDMITLKGVTTAQLLAHQSDFHFI